MKETNNNEDERAIKWIGPSYEPDIETYNCYSAPNALITFYKQCTVGKLSLKVGDFVLINTNETEPDSAVGCDIACIEHMFTSHHLNSHKEVSCHAGVRWYTRPQDLPVKTVSDENYTFDFDHEVVEDFRYSPRVDLDSIIGHCHVEIVEPELTFSDVASKMFSKRPSFVARYKLTKVENSRKTHLLAIKGSDEKINKQKRKSMVDKTKSSSKRDPLTPRISRSKSISDLDIQNDKKREMKLKGHIDIDAVTRDINEIDIISDEENISPRKMARTNARRKSGNFRRNLAATLRNESPSSSDAEIMNYSIITDETKSSNMKIKLRLSEHQKPAVETPTKRSTRKRSTNEEDNPAENQISPRKTRRSVVPEDETPMTPTSRPRRKSILKTPTLKHAESNVGSVKRNIQLSNIAEEFSEGRRSIRKLTAEPDTTDNEEPKTPRARGRPPKAEYMVLTPKTGTPKSATKLKLFRSGAIKPSIHARDIPVETSPDDQLATVRERLHVSAVPQSLPCRGKEFDEIYNFVEGKIIDGCGGCMYVSGVPGTGKTATTTAVIRSLQKMAKEKSIPEFEFMEINGMRLTEPRQAYVHIYRQLTGKTLTWEQAYDLLNKRFTLKKSRQAITVLLVDELDILCNRRQDVVYNLLNWPTTSSSHLIVITIANTMDLPERLLMGKISSRLGLTRLTFQPYNFRQLQEIVVARLLGTSAFETEAVQLVARKVAAVSGDARRALDICRRATELAEDASRKTGNFVSVSMGLVQQALGEMIASAKVQTIKCCSRLEQLFLQAVTAEVARTGIEECNFLGVYSQFEALAAFAGITVPNPSRAIAICGRLGASRLLICEDSRNDIYQKILLNISSDDVHYALQASGIL